MTSNTGENFDAKSMEMPGIDPGTSRMLSERSTIWATPPRKLFKYNYTKINPWSSRIFSITIYYKNRFQYKSIQLYFIVICICGVIRLLMS